MPEWNRRPAWRDEDGGPGYGRGTPSDRGRPALRAATADRRAGAAASGPDATSVHHLLGDLGALLQGAVLAIREFGRVGGRVRDSVGDVADAVGEAWQVTREHGGSALDTATEIVDRRPYVAIGLAAAIGVIAGFAIQRGLGALGESDDGADGWDHFV